MPATIMSRSIVIESVTEAWARTRAVLLTRPDPDRWLKYAFIAMLGVGTMSGSSFNFSLPGGPSGGESGDWTGPGEMGPEALRMMASAARWLGESLGALVALAVGLTLIWIAVVLVAAYLKSVFRFIFVEAVAAPTEPSIRRAFLRHSGRGLALLLWYIVIGMVPLILILLALIPILASAGLISSGRPLGTVLGAGGILALVGLIVFAVLLLIMFRALTEDFLVPAMYAKRSGVIEGWRSVARAWQGELANVVLFYIVKLGLGLGVGIVMAFAVILSLVLLALPALSLALIVGLIALANVGWQASVLAFGLPALITLILGGATYGYLLQVLLLPMTVFFQAYSLSFIGKLDPALRTF